MDYAAYIGKQLQVFFPNASVFEDDVRLLGGCLDVAHDSFMRASLAIRVFNGAKLDPFHIMQYPIFLYKLSRALYESMSSDDTRLADRIHALNKYLHGCSIFYKVKLPEVFFLNYASSCVLGAADYGEYLMVGHSVTVGTLSTSAKPKIGDNVILMPNSMVSDSTVIGDNCIVSVGVRLINVDVPSNCIVFETGGGLVFKENNGKYADKFFLRER